MRARKKKHGAERLLACADLMISKPAAPLSAADINGVFGREGKAQLEIGCGKGSFACGMSAQHSDVNFIALERISDIMVTAAERARDSADEREGNLRFIVADAKELAEYFAPESLDTIYLNFSDPWPKKGHTKRRLTYREFLSLYFSLIAPGGKLRFKTDNKGLFDFSLEELDALGYTCDYVTYDLHTSEYAEGNVMTEYERNFSSQGVPICALSVTKK